MKFKDPWRVVDPLRSTNTKPSQGKINLEDKDLEADLKPTHTYVLRFKACSIEVAGTDVNRPEDALARLARCVIALKQTELSKMLTTVHAKTADSISDLSPSEIPAARLQCGDSVIEFVRTPLDHGALALVRVLMIAERNTKLAPILRVNGITPMLRS